MIRQGGVGPGLRVEERLHPPAGQLLQAPPHDGREQEELPGTCLLAPQPEREGGEQDRARAVQRGERPPHQADTGLGKAGRGEHPDLLEQKACHGAQDEDEHDLIPAQAEAIEKLLAFLAAGLQHLRALTAREAGAEDLLGLLGQAPL